MNSIEHKLVYVLRIHDKEETEKIFGLLKNRNCRFGLWLHDGKGIWREFKNVSELTNYKYEKLYDFGDHDYYIRVYFSNVDKREAFRKEAKILLGEWYCGNDKCSNYCNGKCIFGDIEHTYERVEYLWRCIKKHESITTMEQLDKYWD